MNLETLVELSKGENFEILVKVGNKTYHTAPNWVDIDEKSFVVNVTAPIQGLPIEDKDILEKVKLLGCTVENPTLYDVLTYLRTEKGVYINVESGFQRIGIFGTGDLVHRGNIIIESEKKSLTLDSVLKDYNQALLYTLKQYLEYATN